MVKNLNRGSGNKSRRWSCLACGRKRTTTNARPFCANCKRFLDPYTEGSGGD